VTNNILIYRKQVTHTDMNDDDDDDDDDDKWISGTVKCENWGEKCT
jgi:hypothetical protein